jgi:hypothetical protein
LITKQGATDSKGTDKKLPHTKTKGKFNQHNREIEHKHGCSTVPT